MARRLFVSIAAGIGLAASVSGCGQNATSSATDAAPGNRPASSDVMTPAQRQAIAEAGKAHQAGGRIRARLMQQGARP